LGLAAFLSFSIIVGGYLLIACGNKHIFAVITFIAFATANGLVMQKWSNAKIGGVTGDVLGATIEIAELGMLALACLL
jgi:cobalamin synthase